MEDATLDKGGMGGVLTFLEFNGRCYARLGEVEGMLTFLEIEAMRCYARPAGVGGS